MSCLRFGVNNYVENCTLTSVPTALTSLENLKTEWRGRQTKFSELTTATIVITGELPTAQYSDFFSLLGSNLTADATVQLELFETDVSVTDLLNMTPITVGDITPLGVWEAGIDPYGQRLNLSNIQTYWFPTTIQWQRFELTITHDLTTGTPVSDGIFRQDGSGTVSIEAESFDSKVAVGSNAWTDTADAGASGSYMDKSGPNFYNNHEDGPYMLYTFTAAVDGAHDMWARINTSSGANSFYSVFDGSVNTHVEKPVNATWHWVNLRTVSFVSERTHLLKIAARDYDMKIDKIVFLTAGSATPTGDGPAESGDGTTTSSENVLLRMLMIGDKLQMATSFSNNNQVQFLTDPDLMETSSGYFVPGKAQSESRKMTLPIEIMDDADRLQLADMEITQAGRPFLVSAYPDLGNWQEMKHTMLARFPRALSYQNIHYQAYRSTIQLVEV